MSPFALAMTVFSANEPRYGKNPPRDKIPVPELRNQAPTHGGVEDYRHCPLAFAKEQAGA